VLQTLLHNRLALRRSPKANGPECIDLHTHVGSVDGSLNCYLSSNLSAKSFGLQCKRWNQHLESQALPFVLENSFDLIFRCSGGESGSYLEGKARSWTFRGHS
jgi:hypothetical protein